MTSSEAPAQHEAITISDILNQVEAVTKQHEDLGRSLFVHDGKAIVQKTEEEPESPYP